MLMQSQIRKGRASYVGLSTCEVDLVSTSIRKPEFGIVGIYKAARGDKRCLGWIGFNGFAQQHKHIALDRNKWTKRTFVGEPQDIQPKPIYRD